jgi:hypothetical protein
MTERPCPNLSFPAQISVPLAVGPEVPREGVAAIRSVLLRWVTTSFSTLRSCEAA